MWDVSGSPEPSLTISFIKKESFRPNRKGREGDCLLNPHWQLVLTEGSALFETADNGGYINIYIYLLSILLCFYSYITNSVLMIVAVSYLLYLNTSIIGN